jgi:leucyl/phenylalanyl-tRNA---protein transferase
MTRRIGRERKLSPELFLAAYSQGYFPMAQGPDGPVGFYSYDPRGILPLDDRFTVRKSLRQIINRGDFEIRFDTNVEEVLRGCARHNIAEPEEIWLSDEMIAIYLELHRQGVTHTVEAWSRNVEGTEQLVGGLYGLTLGGAFCGESMFSIVPYASQVALVALVERLRKRGFVLLDGQMVSEHLKQFGLIETSHLDYLIKLKEALRVSASF